MQFGIGIAAFGVLTGKYMFEKSRRPLLVYGIDCLKQVVGGGVAHFTKVGFSRVMRSADDEVDDCHDAGCLWYLTQSLLQPIFVVPMAWLLLRILKYFAEKKRGKGEWGHHLIPWGIYAKRHCVENIIDSRSETRQSNAAADNDDDRDLRFEDTPTPLLSAERRPERFSLECESPENDAFESPNRRLVNVERYMRNISWRALGYQVLAWGFLVLIAAIAVAVIVFLPLHTQLVSAVRSMATPLRCHSSAGGNLELIMFIFTFPLCVDIMNYIAIDFIIKRRVGFKGRSKKLADHDGAAGVLTPTP